MKGEPVMTSAAVVAIVGAVIGLLVSFGVWSPTTDQLNAINTTVTVIVVPVLAWITRGKVSPN